MGSQNLRRRCVCVLALTHGTVVVREVHAAWKSAYTLCNVCAGFHVMYIHEIGEEKNIHTMHHLYVFVSQRGEWLGRNNYFSFLKEISVFTDDHLQ